MNFRLINNNLRKYHYYLAFLLFVITTIVFVKYNKSYLLSGVDFDFHRLRLLGLIQSLQNGDFFPSINYIMANGFGYGVPMFYGQWFLYLPAIMVAYLNFTFTRAFLALYVVYYISVLLLNYFVGRKFKMGKIRSLLFSLLLVFNPLVTSIVNGDLPFAICLMLVPSLFYTLWRIVYFNEKKFIPLGVTIAIVIMTHVLSTIVMAIVSLLWVLVHLNKLNKFNLIEFSKAILLSMLLSITFWLSLLQQMFAQKLKGSGLADAFRYRSVHGIDDILMNSLADSIASITRFPNISLVGLLLFIALLFSFKKVPSFDQKMILITSFLIFFSSDLFPWVYLGHTPIGAVQFVGRYLIFALMIIITIGVRSKNISNYFLVFCIMLTFSSAISGQMLPSVSNDDAIQEYQEGILSQQRNERYNNLNNVDKLLDGSETENGISGGEYINESADIALDGSRVVESESVDLSNVIYDYGEISFDYTVNTDQNEATILVPFLWYNGYVATYSEGGSGTQPRLSVEENGKEVKDDGKISLEVEGQGSVSVFFEKTIVKKISMVISLVSWISLIIYFSLRIRSKSLV